MQAINPLLLLLEEQAAQIDVLEGRVQDLTLALRLDATANVQSAFGISESLAQLLILLVDGKPRSKEQLHAGLFYRRPDVDAPDTKLIDTLVCKLRKQIKQFGVELTTVWSAGYKITAGAHVLRSAIEGSDHQALQAARERKRERDRLWRRAIRAAQGCKDRQSYQEFAVTHLQPWRAEGISQATWYRRKKSASVAANDDAPLSRRIRVAA